MIKQENELFTRINRKQARNLYNAGFPVFLLPCKVRLENSWVNPCEVKKEEINTISSDGFNTIVARNDQFETVINCYEYYNCQYNELGKYAAFYARKEILK